MTLKPTWLTRAKILAFGLALYTAGLFTPIYQTAERSFGVEETAELFRWILAAKDEVENPTKPVDPTPVVAPDDGDILAGASWGPKKEG